ncbi:MAG TPA: vanadium-dependent haloperoxidase [Thermoanaerobaculia bacterium]|nr:vanadium-dependent haloperoxidase [Thermoanaerobaculia bacterium]
MKKTWSLGAPAAALLVAALAAPLAAADVVTDWNDVLLDSIRAARTNPPVATRGMAMLNVAVFDAVVAIEGGYESYADHGPAPAGASAEAAVSGAAHAVLVHLYPTRQAIFDAELAERVAALPPGLATTDGLAWGAEVAADVIALRTGDGFDAVVPYGSIPGAGWWVPTPPAFAGPLLPGFGAVTPWTMTSGDQFRVPSPPPPSSPEFAAAFDEVKRLGGADSVERTPDQSEIARFWDDGAGSQTPPGHWNDILQGIAEEQGLSLVDSARLFALHGLTVADASIVAWDAKFYYNCWRPVTGIRTAADDGNPATEPDPEFTSFIGTPPFPAYTSGHSTYSGSSSRVAALFFGTDDFDFSVTSDLLPGVERHFTSLSQAAEEAGQSRIYGGIHWQFDNTGGLSSGRALAESVFFNFLRPVADEVEPCDPATQLCLDGGRFAVDASWRAPNGESGVGHPVPLNDGSGSFWFFQDDNTEVTVKLIDACEVPEFGRFWVFASGLTNVEVALTVTDTQTGATRTYFNPLGRPFESVQDTDAFLCQ